MDIPNESLFVFNYPPLTHPNARRLKMKDPRRVNCYNNSLDKLYLEEQMYYYMDNLHQTATDPMIDMQQK